MYIFKRNKLFHAVMLKQVMFEADIDRDVVNRHPTEIKLWFKNNYCKCITFGDVFFLAPLAVVSIRQIKYIAKCASI